MIDFSTIERRELLKEVLRNFVVEVEFQKVDGSKRNMLCTLQQKLMRDLKSTLEFEEPFPEMRKRGDTAIPVFDLEKREWRSIRWNSVIYACIVED